MPSAQEVKKFELEDLKRKNTNGAKNIEEIDFGPYRRNRGAIIKTARELEQHQSHDYAAERQELAEELAGKVTDRTMGIIRHSIIAPVAMPAVNFCVDTLSGHLMSLGSKDPSEDFGVAAGDRDVKKSLFNKWLDKREEDKALKIAREAASNLSDDELKTRAEELMGRKYILFGEMVLSTEGKALVQEYQSRFKEEKFKRSIEAVSTELDLAPGGAILKHLVEKATGEKIGSPGEPTASIGTRLTAERKVLKVGDSKTNLKQWFLPSGEPVKLGDINWNHKRTDGPPEFIGRTNKEAGRAGLPPQLADGSFVVVGKAHDDLAIASPGAGKANSLDTTPHSNRIRALDVGEANKINFGPKYKNYSAKVEWVAPAGTKQIYQVYPRNDIPWDRVRTNPKGDYRFVGKTNREAALAGVRPELHDGNFVTLHHVGQDSRGPLVEVSTKIHNTQNRKAFKVLHNQFGGKSNPDFPVDHGTEWRQDTSAYWKWRVKNDK
jgi:hypothetical protein